MKTETIHIKNMVCPRCIIAVEQLFEDLQIDITSIRLGSVTVSFPFTEQQYENLKTGLDALGFELLESERSALISQMKSLIIDQLRNKQEKLHVNFSTFLSENLNHEYTYLSRLFSATEGITIEKFITTQKIERVKELLFYDQLTLSEIAFQMDYSSVAYLSAQFKKETGMTPSAFKKQNRPGHRYLDDI